jgi:alpha-beta hydrolase superfamily lysophospholipase
MRWSVPVLVALLATACAPQWREAGEAIATANITPHAYVTTDGTQLPLHIWQANPHPRAVLLALHGMNDYANAFARPAAAWSQQGITSYAYDQRSFGGAPYRGLWPGADTLVQDAQHMTRLLRARHPGVPLYLLGESMGAAVVMLALRRPDLISVDGVILSAPAVWGGEGMNPIYRLSLWLGAHLVPDRKFTGQSLKRWASDNIETLRGLGRDPLFIKGTRVDALYGLTSLMGEAFAEADYPPVPMLVLYGARDEIVPSEPVLAVLKRLPPHRAVFYREGCHMLMRDLQAERVWRDIRAWIDDKSAPLSGEHAFPKTAPCRPPGWQE